MPSSPPSVAAPAVAAALVAENAQTMHSGVVAAEGESLLKLVQELEKEKKGDELMSSAENMLWNVEALSNSNLAPLQVCCSVLQCVAGCECRVLKTCWGILRRFQILFRC